MTIDTSRLWANRLFRLLATLWFVWITFDAIVPRLVLQGPSSRGSRLIDSLAIPFDLVWFSVVWLTRRRKVQAWQALAFGLFVGFVNGARVGLQGLLKGNGLLISVGVGLLSAILGGVTIAGLLVWWHARGGRERFLQEREARAARRSLIVRLLIGSVLLGVVVGAFVGCYLARTHP